MNRAKKLMVGILIWTTVTLLSACATNSTLTTNTVQDSINHTGSIENYGNDTRFYIYIDPETGVNYIVYAAPYKGGITPRYNANGSLFVTEK